MDANLLRRVNWLWKHRHTHDDDTGSDLEQRIIRIETKQDTFASNTGAYIHLGAGSQSIDGGTVSFSKILAAALAIDVPSFPATGATIHPPGYYDIDCYLETSNWHKGGTVWLDRTRDGVTTQIWPPTAMSDLWASPGGSIFKDTAPAIDIRPGDVYELRFDAGTAVSVSRAFMVPRLIDRVGANLAPGQAQAGEPALVYSQLGDFVFFQTQYSLPLPSDIQAGDLLVLIINPDEPSSITGDFTLLDSDTRTAVYWKVAEGDEGSSVTVTFGSASHIAAASLRFRLEGVDWATQPPEVVIGDSGTTSPFSFPSDVAPTQGPGSYWVIPFFSQTVFDEASYDASGVSYPELVYAHDEQGLALGSLWVGARFEAVASSVSPGSIAMSGSGTGFEASNTGILFVKGL